MRGLPTRTLTTSGRRGQYDPCHKLVAWAVAVKFAQFGDPRKWKEFDRVTPITWTSDLDRERTEASYDEWSSGAWNDVPGVVKPGLPFWPSLSE